jgi:hypothetical protein
LSQFDHVKGLLRNKDINKKCKLDIFKMYLIEYYMEQQQTKRHDSKIQAMEMKFLRAILNKTKKDWIRNTNIRLELGVDEIKMSLKRAD